MQAYLVKRFVGAVVVVFGVTVLVFGAIRLFPGDAVTAIMSQSGTSSPAQEARLRHELGLDKPAGTQYLHWIGGILHGDLGHSMFSGDAVAGQLGSRLPVTGELAAGALLLGVLLGVPIGVLSAVKRGTIVDYLFRLIAIFGISVPDFVVATILSTWIVTRFGWAPAIVYVSPWHHPLANVEQFILPCGILGYYLSATTARMTRSAMLEILREDYVRTAWSKGLRQRAVVFRHCLPNAILPVVTIIGLQAGYLLAGSVLIETVFNLPGMGSLLVQSITVRDYPQIQAFVLLIAMLMVVVNILVDLSYSFVDPRLRNG